MVEASDLFTDFLFYLGISLLVIALISIRPVLSGAFKILERMAGPENEWWVRAARSYLQTPLQVLALLGVLWGVLAMWGLLTDGVVKALSVTIGLPLIWLLSRLFDFAHELIIRYFKWDKLEDENTSSRLIIVTQALTLLKYAVIFIYFFFGYLALFELATVTRFIFVLAVEFTVAGGGYTSVKNLFGGMYITFLSPFQYKTHCSVGNLDGTVEEVSLRATKLKTREKTMISVPNSIFLHHSFTNYSYRMKREIYLRIALAPSTDIETLMDAMAAIADQVEAAVHDMELIAISKGRRRITGSSSLMSGSECGSHLSNQRDTDTSIELALEEEGELENVIGLEQVNVIGVRLYVAVLDEQNYARAKSDLILAVTEVLQSRNIIMQGCNIPVFSPSMKPARDLNSLLNKWHSTRALNATDVIVAARQQQRERERARSATQSRAESIAGGNSWIESMEPLSNSPKMRTDRENELADDDDGVVSENHSAPGDTDKSSIPTRRRPRLEAKTSLRDFVEDCEAGQEIESVDMLGGAEFDTFDDKKYR